MTSIEIFRELPNEILRNIYTQAIVIRNAENFEQKLKEAIEGLNLWKEAANKVGFTSWEDWEEDDREDGREIVIGNHEYIIPNGNKLRIYTTWHNDGAWAQHSAEITDIKGKKYSIDWDCEITTDEDEMIEFAKAIGIQVDKPDDVREVLAVIFD